MKLALTVIQVILAIVVTTLILLQAKGTGLGRAFGSQMYHSRRGIETLLFRSTIALVIAFVLLSVVIQLFVA